MNSNDTIERDRELMVKRHRELLVKRNNLAMAAEHLPPVGQAYFWYQGVIPQVPECARNVAHQIARLCGDDSQVRTTYRSLADAVGKYDKTGPVAYVQRGVRMLVDVDWLSVKTIGQKRAARTTFYLEAGEDSKYKSKWDDAIYVNNDWVNHFVA